MKLRLDNVPSPKSLTSKTQLDCATYGGVTWRLARHQNLFDIKNSPIWMKLKLDNVAWRKSLTSKIQLD